MLDEASEPTDMVACIATPGCPAPRASGYWGNAAVHRRGAMGYHRQGHDHRSADHLVPKDEGGLSHSMWISSRLVHKLSSLTVLSIRTQPYSDAMARIQTHARALEMYQLWNGCLVSCWFPKPVSCRFAWRVARQTCMHACMHAPNLRLRLYSLSQKTLSHCLDGSCLNFCVRLHLASCRSSGEMSDTSNVRKRNGFTDAEASQPPILDHHGGQYVLCQR